MLRLSHSNVSLIQGLIAVKGLKTTLRLVLYKACYFRNLRISGKKKKEKKKENTSTKSAASSGYPRSITLKGS